MYIFIVSSRAPFIEFAQTLIPEKSRGDQGNKILRNNNNNNNNNKLIIIIIIIIIIGTYST